MFRATVPALVVVLSVLALPANALAAQAIRTEETVTRLVCSNLSNDAGLAYVGVTITDQEGSWAELAFWATPGDPDGDAPTWNALSSAISLSADGSTLSASFDVYDPNEGGEEFGGTAAFDEVDPTPSPSPAPTPVPTPVVSPGPTASPSQVPTPGPSTPPSPVPTEDPSGPIAVGEGVLEATLTPVGDPESYSSKDRAGNRKYTFTATSQPLAVTGTLSLPNNIAFDLAACEGTREVSTFAANDPAVSVDHFGGLRLSCSWSSETEFVTLFAGEYESGMTGEVWVQDATGFYAGWGPAVLTTSAFETTFDLADMWTEEGTVVGSAASSAVLDRGARLDESESYGGVRIERKGWWFDVDGSLTIATPAGTRSYTLDAESCLAARFHISELPMHTAKPAPIVNDTPDGAIEISQGETVTTSTAGTQPDPEAPCLIEDPDGGTHEAPIGSTVWYTFMAPGGSITVDTVGSHFDTVVGVYAVDGDGLVNVACNDDPHDSLEARVTVDTVANATYFIQAGGYGGSSGTLFVSLNQP